MWFQAILASHFFPSYFRQFSTPRRINWQCSQLFFKSEKFCSPSSPLILFYTFWLSPHTAEAYAESKITMGFQLRFGFYILQSYGGLYLDGCVDQSCEMSSFKSICLIIEWIVQCVYRVSSRQEFAVGEEPRICRTVWVSWPCAFQKKTWKALKNPAALSFVYLQNFFFQKLFFKTKKKYEFALTIFIEDHSDESGVPTDGARMTPLFTGDDQMKSEFFPLI